MGKDDHLTDLQVRPYKIYVTAAEDQSRDPDDASSVSLYTYPPTHQVPWVCGDDSSFCSLPVCIFLSCPAVPRFPLLYLPCLFKRGKRKEAQKKPLGSSPALF